MKPHNTPYSSPCKTPLTCLLKELLKPLDDFEASGKLPRSEPGRKRRCFRRLGKKETEVFLGFRAVRVQGLRVSMRVLVRVLQGFRRVLVGHGFLWLKI